MTKYRKKPVVVDVVVEAMQFIAGNYDRCFDFVTITTGSKSATRDASGKPTLTICTPEGDMVASEGDWIIKSIQGAFYLCKDHIFQSLYEPEEP